MKSKLSNLPSADQNLIIRICSENTYAKAVHLLAKPREEGGIAFITNTAALCRFMQKQRSESLDSRIEQILAESKERSPADAYNLSNAIAVVLQGRILAALVAHRDISAIADEFRFLLRLKRFNQADRKALPRPRTPGDDYLDSLLGRTTALAIPPATPQVITPHYTTAGP